ncbi:hypothetical protein [Herbidospora sp. RD11066]
MEAAAAWVTAIIAPAALAIAYLTYRSQRGKSRLEYVVVNNTSVVPRAVASRLDVTYNGKPIPDASVTVIRIVNTGDKPFSPENFNTELAVRALGAEEIVSASITSIRPPDLNPELSIERDRARIAPLLLNPGDMIEIQLLVAGLANRVILEGRIFGVTPLARKGLPYPPGTGIEGELSNWFEKAMMFIVPGLAISILSIPLLITSLINPIIKAVIAAGVVLVVFVLHPMYIRHLIKMRRLWAP